MNIKQCSHIHFSGIKGVGLTSVALMAKDLGIKVTGSDVAEEFVTDETLKRNNISWEIGFDPKHLEPKPDFIVFTGAHGGLNNPEVLAAKELEIPTFSHFEALAAFAEGKEIIAVCGVGGKTTTSAMIATILEHAGLNPSWAIGVADISSLSNPGHYDREGKYFVTEADEFAISPGIDNRPKFSLLSPKYLVITNIAHDHPDIYKTFEEFKKVFEDFEKKVKSSGGTVVTKSEGFLPDDFKLNVQGDFNIKNANNAYAVCKALEIPEKVILEGLALYTGCKRRFEKIAEINEIFLYDDYAHHPDEVKAILKTTQDWFPKRRILVYFQPHTFSRTKALFKEFSESFNDANFVGIADIFASAREEEDPEVSSEKLVEEIKKHHPNPENVGYAGDWKVGAEYLANTLKPGDVFLTLGAGDIYKVHKLIIKKLNQENKERVAT